MRENRSLFVGLITFLGLLFIGLLASAHADPMDTLRHTTALIVVGGASGSGGVVQSPTTGMKYLISNWHVCRGSTRLQSRVTYQLTVTYPLVVDAKVVKLDPSRDMCAVQVPQDIPAVKVAAKQVIGEAVYTRGYPHGALAESDGKAIAYETVTLDFSDSSGECPKEFNQLVNPFPSLPGFPNAQPKCIKKFVNVVTDLYSLPGSSGSIVLNASGEVVGIMQNHDQSVAKGGGMLTLATLKAFLKGL